MTLDEQHQAAWRERRAAETRAAMAADPLTETVVNALVDTVLTVLAIDRPGASDDDLCAAYHWAELAGNPHIVSRTDVELRERLRAMRRPK